MFVVAHSVNTRNAFFCAQYIEKKVYDRHYCPSSPTLHTNIYIHRYMRYTLYIAVMRKYSILLCNFFKAQLSSPPFFLMYSVHT